MLTNEVDSFPIGVCGLLVVAARLVDHAQEVVAVVDIGEARQELASGLFGLPEARRAQIRWIVRSSTPGQAANWRRNRGTDRSDGQGKSILGL